MFTPLSSIRKAGLDTQSKDVLKKLAGFKANPVVRETKESYLITGGDNVAESLMSVGKKQLRRLGQLGGGKDALEHRNILSAFFVHTHPGVQNVLQALKNLRAKANGTLKPSETFKTPLWKTS